MCVEYGWGGREADDATWRPLEVPKLCSCWGHKGLFEALGRRPAVAAASDRARFVGVCPWWDAVKERTQVTDGIHRRQAIRLSGPLELL